MQAAADYVECPTCSARVTTSPTSFIEGRSVVCSNGHAFNAYAVYGDFYQRIPLASGIGQKLSNAICRSYRVKGAGTDVPKVEAFLRAHNFGSMLDEIVLDTVIYGNAIVDMPGLQRVDLADTTVRFGRGNSRGQAFVSSIESITDSQGRVLGADYVHFTHNRGASGPMGVSAFGGWFQHFYLLRDAPQALANASIMKNLGIDKLGLKTVTQIRDYFASAVLTGTDLVGYPYSFISNPSQILQPPVGIMLRAALDARRAEIRDRIERDIFPEALGRPWQPRNWPEFEISGL